MQKIKVTKKKGFITLGVVIGIFMLGSGIAYYILSHQSTGQVTIKDGITGFVVTADLSDINISVNESLTNTQQIILENENGGLLMYYNLTTFVNGTDPSCDEIGDVSFELSSDEGVIDHQGNFTMEAGTNTFDFTSSAINDRTCPQTIDVTIDFLE